MSKRIFQIECCKAFKNRWFFISLIISGVFAFCGAYIMISNYFFRIDMWKLLMDENGVFIKNPQIFRENDTDNTYRVRAFYVKKVMTLNNYNLIMDIYMNAKKYVPKLRTTIFSFLYEKAINYYTKKNFTETVKALKNIREIENDRFYY